MNYEEWEATVVTRAALARIARIFTSTHWDQPVRAVIGITN
jgi:hypothetical protein